MERENRVAAPAEPRSLLVDEYLDWHSFKGKLIDGEWRIEL